MNTLFTQNSENLFDEFIQKPVESQEEAMERTKQAITYIAQKKHVGEVVVSLSIPQSQLNEKVEGLSTCLYQSGLPLSTEPVALSYHTGDGSIVIITFYAIEDHVWKDEALEDIRKLGNQIFEIFSQMIMCGLLKKAILTDMVVGIPNLTGFLEYAGKVLKEELLNQYHILYLNIHNFEYVNKILPHVQADEVMKLYAQMLVKSLQEDELVARLGGDNFVVLIRNENTDKFIKFVNHLDITYQYDGEVQRFSFGATIGASELNGVKDVGEMMLRATVAYQAARQCESVGVTYYNKELYDEIMQQKEIIAQFHRALSEGEFEVYYQPKITTADKKICGAEALVRWRKDGNIVPPIHFIPILEKEGSICMLDFYVLDKVCALLDKCRKEGVPLTKISVNFSRKHVGNTQLVKEIVEVIDKYNVPHEYLEVELTESEDFRDYVVMSGLIETLKEADISSSIDDFGTGYSSLNMLKMTNIDLLKIDKSFLPMEDEYVGKKKDIIMFENITRLAKELGIKIIAEGVETKQQYEYLVDAGCDMIQGYYFDKPLTEAEFLERMCIGHY